MAIASSDHSSSSGKASFKGSDFHQLIQVLGSLTEPFLGRTQRERNGVSCFARNGMNVVGGFQEWGVTPNGLEWKPLKMDDLGVAPFMGTHHK